MLNTISKHYAGAIIATIFSIALLSCDSGGQQIRYMAAQLVGSDMWSIVDVNTGEVIYKDAFENQPSRIINDKFIVLNENNLYDYYSISDITTPINSESYVCASSFTNSGTALVMMQEGGFAVINDKCEVTATLDNTIVSASKFQNGYSKIETENKKTGYINEKGEIVIEPIYDLGYNFSGDGIAIVGEKEYASMFSAALDIPSDITYYAINPQNEKLFSFSDSDYLDFAEHFSNGQLLVQTEDEEMILLDKTGEQIMSIGFCEDITPDIILYNNRIIFEDNELYGLKDSQGDIIIPAKYDLLVFRKDINSKYYIAVKQGKCGIIDSNDNIIVPFDYNFLDFINDKVLLKSDGTALSFMNIKGEDIGQNKYRYISDWDSSL